MNSLTFNPFTCTMETVVAALFSGLYSALQKYLLHLAFYLFCHITALQPLFQFKFYVMDQNTIV